MAHAGLARTFQTIRLFNELTVLENVEVAAVSSGLSRREASKRALELLEEIGILRWAEMFAAVLPYGLERRVEIARALATQPKFLLLDEPAAGLNEDESEELLQVLSKIPEQKNLGMLIVDHDMRLIMRLCHRLHVLNFGKTIGEGTPEEVRQYSGRAAGLSGQICGGGLTMLELQDIHARYGAITALRGVSITVSQGELVALLGVNGAGKSTTLSYIAGVMRPWKGSITFEGNSLIGKPPEGIARAGISLVPEGRDIFPSLTVEENLRLGAYVRKEKGEYQRNLEEVYELFPVLKERLDQAGGTLSGGEQQQLAIARALMSKPRLLMLDEPSLGLAPALVDQIFELITNLHQRGVTILLVEQNVERSLAIVDRAYLMNTGLIESQGTPEQLNNRADIEGIYMGVKSGLENKSDRSVINLEFIINTLSLGSLYAMLALGLVIIYGILRLVNFAYGELIMVGGYIMYLLTGIYSSALAGCGLAGDHSQPC